MKILTLHCDYIKFNAVKKALKSVKEVNELKGKEKKQQVTECLVVLSAVEKGDENYKSLVKELVENIEDIANQVKINNIVLYPYVHLTSNPSAPDFAEQVLVNAEKELAKKFKVTRAPFGYYKEFELKCKGHPLSELSRQFGSGKEKEEAIKKTERNIISKFVLDKEKLNENDHRIIGQKLDLFSFNEVSPGMVFWHPKGNIIRNKLMEFWRQEHEKAGYKEISTPIMMSNKLWKLSGHWEHYKDKMFVTEENFAIKPMNCPGAMIFFKSSQRSYKELPLRIAELGIVHRKELSGVVAGLFRVWQITQDDAHIFCTKEQLEEEIINIIEMIEKFYKLFNFTYTIELSTKPKDCIGSKEQWNKAEKALQNSLKKKKLKYKLNKGEGAFYGPKIDFHVKDILGRLWQLATIQVDFAMPDRFNIEYFGEDNKKHRPVVIHRVIYGALERFIGILLEHLKGELPLWLAPIQVQVLSFTDRNVKATEKIAQELKKQGLRVETNLKNNTVDYKVREAQLQKIPYIIVIGDKEEKNNLLAVRSRNGKVEFNVKPDDFIKRVKKEIEEKK